jgi:hypothetical protein
MNDAQIAVLRAELSRPEYQGLTVEQAYARLHDPTDPNLPPRIGTAFTAQVLHALGFNQNRRFDKNGNAVFDNPCTMPNVIDPDDFASVFRSL